MLHIKKNIAISESGFVFDPTTGESFSLNPVGLEIIQLIKSGKLYEEITHIITEKYDVDPDTFERYFYDFVATLKQFQLTEPHSND